MCEFKIIKQNDNKQIGEEIVVAQYSEQDQLLLKDILGSAITLESALIVDVNTLNQTLTILEHPLINDFIKLIKLIVNNEGTSEKINAFQKKLEKFKK